MTLDDWMDVCFRPLWWAGGRWWGLKLIGIFAWMVWLSIICVFIMFPLTIKTVFMELWHDLDERTPREDI